MLFNVKLSRSRPLNLNALRLTGIPSRAPTLLSPFCHWQVPPSLILDNFPGRLDASGWGEARVHCSMCMLMALGLLNTKGKPGPMLTATTLGLVQRLALLLYPTSVDVVRDLPPPDASAMASVLATPAPDTAKTLVINSDALSRVCDILHDLVVPSEYDPSAKTHDIIAGWMASRDCCLYQEPDERLKNKGAEGGKTVGRLSLAWLCLRHEYMAPSWGEVRTRVLDVITRTHKVTGA